MRPPLMPPLTAELNKTFQTASVTRERCANAPVARSLNASQPEASEAAKSRAITPFSQPLAMPVSCPC